MDMASVLKAGGVGAAILVVLSLLSLIPCVSCITFFLTLIAYVGIGVLAAYWMAPPRTGSNGAMTGAVAALAASLIGGLVSMIINSIYFAATGSAQFAQALADIPPDQLAALAEVGIDPAMFAGGAGIATVLGVGAFCCLLSVLVAAALGAAGGGYWGSSHPH
jgi:hypothetical protein